MSFTPGIDVSKWQTEIDWPAVSASGIRFAFIKATEGSNYLDPMFIKNWEGAKEAGILRGAYHFFRPLVDPVQQAKFFTSKVKLEKNDLPPVLDLEVNDNLDGKTLIKLVKQWVDTVEAATGKKVILYSGPAFCNTYFSIPAGGPPTWAKDYHLWIANYLEYIPGAKPFMPKGWAKWTFWQHSSKGRVNGIPGHTDLNWFNGSFEELVNYVGASLEDFTVVESTVEPLEKATPQETKTQPATYTIKKGDTLKKVALRLNISLGDLVRANPQLIQEGMKLNIPTAEKETEVTPQPITEKIYLVQPGDTLTAIAERFMTSVQDLVKANNIENPNIIEVGQRLRII